MHENILASSFADPQDVENFRRCKARGGTDMHCFKFGDNGIGCWGDDTTGPVPMVALPPEVMRAKGYLAADGTPSTRPCRGKKIKIWRKGGATVIAEVRDRMPEARYRENGAELDMNAACCAVLGLKPPVMSVVSWEWLDA